MVKTLELCGVDTVFGIPGLHNLEIYGALLNSRIRHITSRHEEGAGYMAYGYSRSTGKPGIIIVISGPGLTNVLTPVAEAFHESKPLVIISSHIPTRFHGTRSGMLHELNDSKSMLRSITKETRTVQSVETIPLYIAEARQLAVSGRPGPVHIEIPYDILEQEAGSLPELNIYDLSIQVPKTSHEQIKHAAGKLISANRPIILAGGGARNSGVQITGLSENIGIPVLLTPGGKGVMDERHPLCLGVRQHFPAIRDYVRQADIMLAVGTEMSEDFYGDPVSFNGTLIQIDMDPAGFEYNLRADIAIHGDAARTIDQLLTFTDTGDDKNPKNKDRVKKIIARANKELIDIFPYEDLPLMVEMVHAIRAALPEDATICADSTQPAYVGISEFPVYQPDSYIYPCGYGTLGLALPAAIGSKIAHPDRAVCVLAGDGGFQFTMAELGVACQNSLCIPVIIWDNSGFGEIHTYEEERFPGKKIAVDHQNPDFIKLAHAYGIEGEAVRNGEEMQLALKTALGKECPSIIVVKARK